MKHKHKPGDRVTISTCAPFDGVGDLESFIGRVGIVIRLFDGRNPSHTVGIGESVDDPVYLVAVHGVGRDLFWQEELIAAER